VEDFCIFVAFLSREVTKPRGFGRFDRGRKEDRYRRLPMFDDWLDTGGERQAGLVRLTGSGEDSWSFARLDVEGVGDGDSK
jgi:hypothetical protein